MSEVLDKTASEQAVVKKKRFVVVDPQRMQSAEHQRRDWVCTAEEGTTVDDILDPGYWAHIASQLTIYDHIEVRIDSGEFVLELLVKDCKRNWAQVVLLHHHDLAGDTKTATAPSDEFEPVFKGPLRKWCVIRKSDSAALQEKLENKAQALEWISSYERTILGR